MAGTQRLDSAAFNSFEQALAQASQELSANLRTLANAIATVDAAWTGGGANAFKQAQMALNDDHDACRRLLDGINEAVIMTQRIGGTNDDDIAGQLKSIDVNGAAAGGHLVAGSNVGGLGAGTESRIDSYM
ncbi:WXG100 family type VII secretion target [Streptomyces sp. NPDC097640]|uniref:WXG100 family type VII secretion target n=1 Tax=Streptomyces sp. NPDC097640 TaxID=3157229 RepID=UPI0033349792